MLGAQPLVSNKLTVVVSVGFITAAFVFHSIASVSKKKGAYQQFLIQLKLSKAFKSNNN